MADIATDGMTRVTWLTTLASTSSPSAAAIENGTDLEGVITADGWSAEGGNDPVDTSALNSTFSTSRAGRSTITISVTFKHQGYAAVPWSSFSGGRPAGYLVVRSNMAAATAYAAGQTVDIYTVVAGDANEVAPAANELAKFTVDFFSVADPVIAATTAA